MHESTMKSRFIKYGSDEPFQKIVSIERPRMAAHAHVLFEY